jgi:hypothetical protein
LEPCAEKVIEITAAEPGAIEPTAGVIAY